MNTVRKIFKRIIAVVLCVGMVLSAPAITAYAEEYSLNRDDTMLTIGNSLVQVKVNQRTGRYVVATEDGLPGKTSDRNRLLSFFDRTPDTSFTTFRIDGKDYIFGNEYAGEGGIVSPTSIQGTTAVTIWQVQGVQVTQKLRLVTDFADPDVGNVRIRYEIANGSGKSVELGSRILLDTMLGSNDGSAMLADRTYVTNETEFSGNQVPMVWQSSDQQYASNVTARGVLYGWEDGLQPDKMIAAHWNTLANTKWDCTVDPYLNFTSSKNNFGRADSAVALYYDASGLAAGESRIYETYYGIGSISDTVGDEGLSVQINAPQKLSLDQSGSAYAEGSDPFEVVVKVTNDTDQVMSDVAVKLGVSDELTMADDSDTVYIDLDAHGSYTHTFHVSPTLQDATVVASLGVQVTSGGITAEGMKYIILPGRKGELPKIQINETAPDTLYTGSVQKKITLKGTGFSLLRADNDWTMTLVSNLSEKSKAISKADIAIADDSTMTVALPSNQDFSYYPGEYRLQLDTERYGKLSTVITMTYNPDFDRIEYGVMLVGKMQDDAGEDYYGVRLLETEEEMRDISDEEMENVLLTIRGTIGTYELGGHEYYTIGNGAIINSAIRYRNSFQSEAVITVTRYSDQPESEDLAQQFRDQFSGWKWFGKVSDSLVLTGNGGLYVGDYLFHVGDFYINLEDDKNYELRGGDDDSNNEDLNDNISDGEIGEGYERTEDVEIITPAGVVGSQLTKTVGALTGFQVEIANAVIGEETISLGGSIAVCLPWWSKAADGGDDDSASDLEKKYNKRDDLNNIGEGSKTDNFLELNMEEMRYGLEESTNSSYLVGVKADGGINLTDDSVPKFTKAGAGAHFAIDSIDYPGWFMNLDGNVKVGDAFECEFGFSLVKEDSGSVYPDSMKFVMGGDVVKIPLGLAGFLNRMGGGISGLYDTIKGNFNVFPPTTLSVYTGYVDPTMFTFTVDEVDMSVGGQGISFEAAEGKVIGLKVFESIGAHLKLYGTKMEDGSVYPCLDVGMDSKINILGIVRGESGFWLVADPKLDTVFGPLSLGGKAYVGIYIPDYIPVVGGVELLAAMAELSSYRVYAGIRVIGIPISVSYYWADGEVKFYDDWEYLSEEFSIPKEDLENALAVTYDTGDANVDGVMLFGDNMTDLSVKESGRKNNYSYKIKIDNNDYSLFQIQYDKKNLDGNESILDHVSLYDPENNEITLTENENCLIQTISAEESDSGVEENYLGIGLTAPVNGTWIVKSDIPLEMEAHKVDEVAGTQASQVTEQDGNLLIDYQVSGASQGATMDAYLVNVGEIEEEPAMLEEETLEDMSEEEISDYYRDQMDAEPSGFKITETPIALEPDAEGNAAGTLTVPVPENLQSGEYMVRLVLNDETGGAVSSDRTENAFTYVNPNTPAPVTGFTMNPGGDGQFLMKWDASDDTEEYFVTLLDENGNEVEGVTGVTTSDNELYFGYTSEEAVYAVDGEGNYVTDENGERIISGSKTVGVIPGQKYIGVVSASRTVDGTTYISEAVRTEPILLPEANPANLTYTLNGKALTASARTSGEANEDNEVLLDNAYTGQSDSSEVQLTITADQDISYLLKVDESYLTDEAGQIIDHSLSAGETAVHSITLADGGSNIEICALNGQGDYTQNTITVEVDTTPPELMLDNSVVQSRGNAFTISGTAENNTSVVVNGETVEVTDGKFVYSGTGNGSTQQITVVAQDRAGNCTTQFCDIIPAELSGLTGISVAVDGEIVDSETQQETMYAGNQSELSFYGTMSNGEKILLDSSKVNCSVLMGDGAVKLEENKITALNAGDAVVMASYPLTDNYSLEQTLMITVAQQPITPAEIQLSDNVIAPEATVGSIVANLYIPGAPEDLAVQWSISENEYLDVEGQSLVLKQMPTSAFTVEISGAGTYHDTSGVERNFAISDQFGFDLMKKVTAVAAINDVSAIYGSAFEQLELPGTVAVTLSTGETTEMQVRWSKGAYNETLAGQCTVFGELILPEGIRNPEELRAKQTIHVRKIDTNTTANDKTITYNGETIDVSDMFVIDPNAGAASYEIVGGSGEGTLSAAQLTVTKAGDFRIRLNTEATASHQAAALNATLTVRKGTRPQPTGLTTTNAETTITCDGTISGVTPEMEYSSDGGYRWKDVEGNRITGLKGGTYLVRYKESGVWLTSENTEVRIETNGKAAQNPIKLTMPESAVYGDEALNVEVDGGSGQGEITFVSSDESVLAIENGKAVIRSAGKAVITAIKAEDETYNASADSREVTISPKTLELEWSGVEKRTYDGTASVISARPINLVGDDICDIRLQGHEAVNAGEYTAKAIGTTNSNYCLSENEEREYQILPASVQIQWENTPKLTYTGVDLLDQIVASWTDIAGARHEAVLMTKNKEPLLHAGTYTVIADTGDSNYKVVSKSETEVTVEKADPLIQLTVQEEKKAGVWTKIQNLLHINTNQKLRLTATVTGVDGKSQTGKVDFYADDVLKGSAVLEGGQASIIVKGLKLGKTGIYANYTPDENSPDHNGGQSERLKCQLGKTISAAPAELIAYATASTIEVEPLSKESVALYGEAQYRIDNGVWQTENEFTGLQSAKTYTVQARFGGNDTCAPSVPQTITVTTMYELIIPARGTTGEGVTEVSTGSNISLEGREIHVTAGKSEDEKTIAVINQNTPDKKAAIPIEESEGNKKTGQIIFRAKMVQ